MILPLGFGKQCRLVKAGPGKPGPVFRAHARKNIVKAETIRYICVISPYWAVKGLINTQNEMKTKHLLLSLLAVAALVSACRKDKEPGENG